jgi:hypothetical protein
MRRPRHEENIDNLFQEFDRENRSTTIEINFQFNRVSFSVMQHHTSANTEGFDGRLERILSELAETAQLVKQPNKKH